MVADSFARAPDVFPPLQYIGGDDVFQNISLYVLHDILEHYVSDCSTICFGSSLQVFE